MAKTACTQSRRPLSIGDWAQPPSLLLYLLFTRQSAEAGVRASRRSVTPLSHLSWRCGDCVCPVQEPTGLGASPSGPALCRGVSCGGSRQTKAELPRPNCRKWPSRRGPTPGAVATAQRGARSHTCLSCIRITHQRVQKCVKPSRLSKVWRIHMTHVAVRAVCMVRKVYAHEA